MQINEQLIDITDSDIELKPCISCQNEEFIIEVTKRWIRDLAGSRTHPVYDAAITCKYCGRRRSSYTNSTPDEAFKDAVICMNGWADKFFYGKSYIYNGKVIGVTCNEDGKFIIAYYSADGSKHRVQNYKAFKVYDAAETAQGDLDIYARENNLSSLYK